MTENEQFVFDAGMRMYAEAIADGDWDQAEAYARALEWLSEYHERRDQEANP